jgi:membrane protein YdbS with pleckstrin-like domain
MSNPENRLTPAEQLASASLNPSAQSPAMEPETDLWTGGFSPKAMIGTWLLSALFSIAVLVVLVLAPSLFGEQVPLNVLWSVGVGIIIAWWAIAIASYAYRRISVGYKLTNQRFIHKHGILVRTTDRIELIDIDDVAFSQGLIQRMLGVGTIRVTSSDRSHPTLSLLGIDEVDRVSGMIDDARRKERRRRSLHIEAS